MSHTIEHIALGETLSNLFKAKFPNQYSTSYKTSLGSVVVLTLLTDDEHIKKNLNGISHNDPFRSSFLLTCDNGIYELDFCKPCLMLNPKQPYLAMHSEQMKHLKKVVGNSEKIIAGFKRFLDKRAEFIQTHKENIYGSNKIDSKYFITT